MPLPTLPQELLDGIARYTITFKGKVCEESKEDAEKRLMSLITGMRKAMAPKIIDNYYKLNLFQLKAPELGAGYLQIDELSIPKTAARVKNLEFILPCMGPSDLETDKWRFTHKGRTMLNFLMMIPQPYTQAMANQVADMRRLFWMDPVNGEENILWQYKFPALEHLTIVIRFYLRGKPHHCLRKVVRELKNIPGLMMPVHPKTLEVVIQGSRDRNDCSCNEEFKELITSLIELKP
ncbi:hypothetical protein DM02DRAFT_649777 [Periconia macrospinosa]|uniref:Uncharacterized protein n=1 Tax=Periconia macrospinosa TaxID=97972 RepID=A0A2V1E9E5_9PLEO|nr:hypothetical protein DM02DRAFT_649777 [Periconia macrospinosa]